MSGIVFINYRRRDAEHVAGRLFDRLEQDFSQDQLFFDVDNIPPGEDFVAFLNRQVDACDVLLAIVGPHWRSQLDARHYGDGEQTKDFVRIEIEAALAKGKKVIPVLVSGAEMPREEDLPESLRPFSRRNAVRLSHERFRADAAGITSALKAALAEAEEARAAADAEAARQRAEDERKAKAEREAKAQVRKDTARRDAAVAGLSREEIIKAEELANWNFIASQDDTQKLRDHLARFPKGVTAPMAGEKLETLLWRDLGGVEDVKALQAFLDEFPGGVHADAARSRVQQLKKAEAERRAAEKNAAQERAAWEAVKETTDHETLAAFLTDWPNGPHAEEARRLKKALSGGFLAQRNVLVGAAGVAIVAALVTVMVMIGLDRVSVLSSLRTFKTDSPVHSISFSPDGRTALSAADPKLELWDMTTGDVIRSFEHPGVKSVAISSDGRTALSAGAAGLKLWDLAAGEEMSPFLGNEAYTEAVAFAPDGRTALAMTYEWDGEEKENNLFAPVLWDVETGKRLRSFGQVVGPQAMALAPDGRTMLSGHNDGTVKLWDVGTGELIRTLKGHGSPVEFIAFIPGGQTALTRAGTTFKLWDLETGDERRSFTRPNDDFSSLNSSAMGLSPDGRTALSGGRDGTLKLWDVGTGDDLRTAPGHDDGEVLVVAFAPDGRTALSASLYGTMKLWDVAVDE